MVNVSWFLRDWHWSLADWSTDEQKEPPRFRFRNAATQVHCTRRNQSQRESALMRLERLTSEATRSTGTPLSQLSVCVASFARAPLEDNFQFDFSAGSESDFRAKRPSVGRGEKM